MLNSGESQVVVTSFTHIHCGLQQILFFIKFISSKMLKMLKIGCFKLFYAKSLYLRCTSRYSHAIFFSTVVKVMLLRPVSHIFAVVCHKICCFKFFNSCKMLKMLKIGRFKQNYCISCMSQGIPMQFLLNSSESHVGVTSFTHSHSALQQILFFKNLNSWKVLKMLKIGCFKLF